MLLSNLQCDSLLHRGCRWCNCSEERSQLPTYIQQRITGGRPEVHRFDFLPVSKLLLIFIKSLLVDKKYQPHYYMFAKWPTQITITTFPLSLCVGNVYFSAMSTIISPVWALEEHRSWHVRCLHLFNLYISYLKKCKICQNTGFYNVFTLLYK